MKRIKVMVPGRADIGIVVKAEVVNGLSVITCDFTHYKVTAPPEFFQLVQSNLVKGQGRERLN